MAAGACARCGGPNPGTSAFCQWCGAALAVSAPPIPATGGYQPLPPPAPYRRPSGSPGAIVGGVVLIVFGLIALAGAAAVNAGVNSYNQACSQNPACQGNQASNPSGGIAVVGVILLVVGGVLIAYGVPKHTSNTVS